MELNAFLNLLPDAFFGLALGGIEGGIAAKSTSARTDFAVAVGATEARVDADFLHAPAELLREVVAVTVETAVITPKVGHGLENSGLFKKVSSVKVFRNALSWAFSMSVSCTPPSITWCISGLMFSEFFTPSL